MVARRSHAGGCGSPAFVLAIRRALCSRDRCFQGLSPPFFSPYMVSFQNIPGWEGGGGRERAGEGSTMAGAWGQSVPAVLLGAGVEKAFPPVVCGQGALGTEPSWKTRRCATGAGSWKAAARPHARDFQEFLNPSRGLRMEGKVSSARRWGMRTLQMSKITSHYRTFYLRKCYKLKCKYLCSCRLPFFAPCAN